MSIFDKLRRDKPEQVEREIPYFDQAYGEDPDYVQLSGRLTRAIMEKRDLHGIRQEMLNFAKLHGEQPVDAGLCFIQLEGRIREELKESKIDIGVRH